MTARTAPRRQPIPSRDSEVNPDHPGLWHAVTAEFHHLKRPVGIIAAVVVGLLVTGILFREALQAYYRYLTLTGLTADTTPIALSIGGEALTIPANMLRFASSRRGGQTDHAELVLLWPTLEGYTR